jgi:dipeptidase E
MMQLLDTTAAMSPGPILLISNSIQYGRGYLDHVETEIRRCLSGVHGAVFVPLAMFDRAAYAARTKARLQAMGFSAEVLEASSAAATIERAESVFVGGGNTFRLLKGLQDLGVMDAIRRRVRDGMPYIGSSAGSIVAGPTLKTTKDMPIVEPASFDALALVDFQISPHYLDPDPSSRHMGETQEERILQFLEENDAPVVGLREGSFLRVEQESVFLGGEKGARIFRRGRAPTEAQPGGRIDSLIRGESR